MPCPKPAVDQEAPWSPPRQPFCLIEKNGLKNPVLNLVILVHQHHNLANSINDDPTSSLTRAIISSSSFLALPPFQTTNTARRSLFVLWENIDKKVLEVFVEPGVSPEGHFWCSLSFSQQRVLQNLCFFSDFILNSNHQCYVSIT